MSSLTLLPSSSVIVNWFSPSRLTNGHLAFPQHSKTPPFILFNIVIYIFILLLFDPINRDIKVLSGERALVDILRSVAHELVHAKQHEDDRLTPGCGDDGHPIER